MFEFLVAWGRFRRYANFWDWVRRSYSDEELRRLAREATDCSLIEVYDPFDNTNLSRFGWENRRAVVRQLIKRYGNEIWSCCLGAGGYDPDTGKVGIQCLSKLDLAFQVHNQQTFEEFLVRNALKRASKQILEDRCGEDTAP